LKNYFLKKISQNKQNVCFRLALNFKNCNDFLGGAAIVYGFALLFAQLLAQAILQIMW
jgi:hypothetical protein